MTTEEIIKRYTEANTKTNCVVKLTKELGVPRSTIIYELLKSGFKYPELQRAMKNDYKAAEAKFQKWIEAGKPEEEIDSKIELTEEVKEAINDYTQSDAKTEILSKLNVEYQNEINDLKKKNEELNGAYQKALSDVVRLTEELNDAKKAIEVLRSDKAELNTIISRHTERIRGLEAEVEEAINEKARAEQLSEQNIGYLKLREEELKNLREENQKLQSESGADEEISNLKDEIVILSNKLQAEALRADITQSDYEADTELINNQNDTISKLKARLQKAERFILNSIYEKMEEE